VTEIIVKPPRVARAVVLIVFGIALAMLGVLVDPSRWLYSWWEIAIRVPLALIATFVTLLGVNALPSSRTRSVANGPLANRFLRIDAIASSPWLLLTAAAALNIGGPILMRAALAGEPTNAFAAAIGLLGPVYCCWSAVQPHATPATATDGSQSAT
jgi:hypothetical protein